MTRKNPTKRRAKRRLDDLEADVGATDDNVTVTIRTWGVDLAENVDDVDRDDGVAVTSPEPCAVDACDESALVDGDRCAYHYDGDSGGDADV